MATENSNPVFPERQYSYPNPSSPRDSGTGYMPSANYPDWTYASNTRYSAFTPATSLKRNFSEDNEGAKCHTVKSMILPTLPREALSRVACLVVGISLAVITAVASYYCFLNGFNHLECGHTLFGRFIGGSLVYMGLAFSIVAVANLGWTVFRFCLPNIDPDEDFEYSKREASIQVAGSILAPIAFIPIALYSGVVVATN